MKSFSVSKLAIRCLIALSVAFAAHIASIQDVSARNLFVSPAGSGTTGQNWASAWKDPAQIDWTKVASGDHIVVDGGTSGITYKTSVTVPVSNIVIRQSGAVGHSGQVIFSGAMPGYPLATGMKFVGSNIHLVGVRRSGIKLEFYGAEGVNIQTSNNSLRNVEISRITGFPPYAGGKKGGVVFGGSNNHFINCDFRDCGIGAFELPVAGVSNISVFNNCTFGSNGYGFWANNGCGIQGSKAASGVPSVIYAHKCVFGPYVDYGVDIASGSARVTNSLFLSARLANIRVAPAAGNSANVNVANCTLYQKKLNLLQPLPYGVPEYVISLNAQGTMRVSNSIIWGGFVDVPAAQKINGSGNIQYAVSGNTVALAPSLVDPQFVDSAALSTVVAPSAFIPRTLTTLNFSLVPGSAAVGKGSPIAKVSDICASYGPIYGLPSNVGGP
ncbi:MAG: hypothetical protein Q8T09_18645 [Candidatus Melainabacteria bacterium]|nr:hypothetical protein [Candidatus Melainabacteria bacterium]